MRRLPLFAVFFASIVSTAAGCGQGQEQAGAAPSGADARPTDDRDDTDTPDGPDGPVLPELTADEAISDAEDTPVDGTPELEAPEDDPPSEPSAPVRARVLDGEAAGTMFLEDGAVAPHASIEGNAPVDATGPEAALAGGNGISYHRGPIMSGRTHVYYLFYGDISRSTKSLLKTFARNIGGSRYFALNTLYRDRWGHRVANSVGYGGSTTFRYYHGRTLSDGEIYDVVHDAINGGRVPRDAHGVYFVVGAADVYERGLCESFCGWHDHGYMVTKDATQYKYAFIGNPRYCPSHDFIARCDPQTKSPNGNPTADAMVNIVAHELEEAVTDPLIDAWYSGSPATGISENADKCAWKFPGSHRVANGSRANVHLGTRDYLIQANWLNENGGGCRMALP